MPRPDVVLRGQPGECYLLLGNEAVARGIVEAGVGVMTTYPGTPSSEIADTVSAIAREAGIYMEYSTNEKVAVEVAAGAAISHVRSAVCMKHVGLNVAADAFMTLAYVGVRAGMVVITADDPNCWSSQNEQDNRYYALLSGLPCLEPSTPQEAKDMFLRAVELSERLEVPCLLRLVTRVSHTRGPVLFGPRRESTLPGRFERDVARFVMVPAFARVRHRVLLERMRAAREEAERAGDLNYVAREGGHLGVITAGAAFNYVMEALDTLGLEASVLKLGMVHPFPAKLVADFAARFDDVLVVEELEPYLELHTRAALQAEGVRTRVHGKLGAELLPRHGELSTRLVVEALCRLTGAKAPLDFSAVDERVKKARELLPPRPPVLCPGCPHRASFYVIKRVVGHKAVCTTDIGCYALGIQKPLEMGDFLICMGASVGGACGFSRALGERVVAVVGDSTFFHAAIPALVDAVYNQHAITVAVLDNLTTAMTGGQPHPGMGITGTGEPGKRVLIEEVARGCGVEHVFVVDPFDVREATRVFRQAVRVEGPSVVVFRQKCRLLAVREARRAGRELPRYHIDPEACRGLDACGVCVKAFGCPAFYVREDGKVAIDRELCTGCGVCAQVCPHGAIGLVGASEAEEGGA